MKKKSNGPTQTDPTANCRTCQRAGPEEPVSPVPGSGYKCWCPILNRYTATGIRSCMNYLEKKRR